MVTRLIEEAGSKIEVDDRRVTGDALELSPSIHLKPQQEEAVEALLTHELGLLVAPPGSGKTVMACAVIARRAVPTLVLVDRKTLADQWRRQIHDLLGTKPGQLGGGRSKLTGVVDIATLQTLARRTDLADKLSTYGQIVVDECHHVPGSRRRYSSRRQATSWVKASTAPPSTPCSSRDRSRSRRLVQYAGRILRAYPGKQTAVVHDCVPHAQEDRHVAPPRLRERLGGSTPTSRRGCRRVGGGTAKSRPPSGSACLHPATRREARSTPGSAR